MTVLGQFVGFAGRSVGSAIDGSGADTDPWKFEFQNLTGGSTFVDVRDATGYYFEYVPLLDTPAGYHAAGDLVDFRPVEAVFQGFAGTFPKGVVSRTLQVYGWVNYTFHYGGEEYPNTTDPYVILVDPDHAGCYILANLLEIQNLTPPSA
jgi:hypothetical protein